MHLYFLLPILPLCFGLFLLICEEHLSQCRNWLSLCHIWKNYHFSLPLAFKTILPCFSCKNLKMHCYLSFLRFLPWCPILRGLSGHPLITLSTTKFHLCVKSFIQFLSCSLDCEFHKVKHYLSLTFRVMLNTWHSACLL